MCLRVCTCMCVCRPSEFVKWEHAHTHACRHTCTRKHSPPHTRSCMWCITHTHTHPYVHAHAIVMIYTNIHSLTYSEDELTQQKNYWSGSLDCSWSHASQLRPMSPPCTPACMCANVNECTHVCVTNNFTRVQAKKHKNENTNAEKKQTETENRKYVPEWEWKTKEKTFQSICGSRHQVHRTNPLPLPRLYDDYDRFNVHMHLYIIYIRCMREGRGWESKTVMAVYMFMNKCVPPMYVNTQICISIYRYIHTYVHTRTHTNTRKYIRIYIWICICIYI